MCIRDSSWSVPVLSQLSSAAAARTPGRDEEVSPRRTPARTARGLLTVARHAGRPFGDGPSRRQRPLSEASPTDPTLRANPFPEVTDPVCRLPLPTLFRRPEAANLGDLLRMLVRPGARLTRSRLIFQGSSGVCPDCTASAQRFGTQSPFRRANRFQGRRRPYKEKRTQPGTPDNVTSFVRVAAPPRDHEGLGATLRYRVRELTPDSLSRGAG